jgi:hypothetical protein
MTSICYFKAWTTLTGVAAITAPPLSAQKKSTSVKKTIQCDCEWSSGAFHVVRNQCLFSSACMFFCKRTNVWGGTWCIRISMPGKAAKILPFRKYSTIALKLKHHFLFLPVEPCCRQKFSNSQHIRLFPQTLFDMFSAVSHYNYRSQNFAATNLIMCLLSASSVQASLQLAASERQNI